VRECGGVAALVRLLAPGGSAALHAYAARALRNLCSGNAHNSNSVRECGGVAALVGLLAPGSSAAVREQAAAALLELCSVSAQSRDAECRGVAALVGLLRLRVLLLCTSMRPPRSSI